MSFGAAAMERTSWSCSLMQQCQMVGARILLICNFSEECGMVTGTCVGRKATCFLAASSRLSAQSVPLTMPSHLQGLPWTRKR